MGQLIHGCRRSARLVLHATTVAVSRGSRGGAVPYPILHTMPKPRSRFLQRIAELAPPVVRERVIPVLENQVLPILSHLPGPAIKITLVYVVLQVMLSQSTSVQGAWAAAKRLTPRPVHSAVAAVGETSVGGAVWSASLSIRSGADWVFRPVHDIHEQQKDRGEEAADGLMHIQRAIDGVVAPPATPSVDELMKKVEEGTPPGSRNR